MAMTANMNRDPNYRAEPFLAVDFMNFIERPPEPELTPEQLEQHLKNIFGA